MVNFNRSSHLDSVVCSRARSSLSIKNSPANSVSQEARTNSSVTSQILSIPALSYSFLAIGRNPCLHLVCGYPGPQPQETAIGAFIAVDPKLLVFSRTHRGMDPKILAIPVNICTHQWSDRAKQLMAYLARPKLAAWHAAGHVGIVHH